MSVCLKLVHESTWVQIWVLFSILLYHKAIAMRGSVVETKGYKKWELSKCRLVVKTKGYKKLEVEVRKWTQERRDDRGQVSFLWQCLQAKRPFMHPKIQNTILYKIQSALCQIQNTQIEIQNTIVARCHFCDNTCKRNGPSCILEYKILCKIPNVFTKYRMLIQKNKIQSC